MTRDWDEALLVAYVDRELGPEDMRRAERAVAADPEARALVDLMSRSAEAAAGAFGRPLREAPPHRLVETIERRRHALPPAPARPPRRWATLALAASLAALAVGFGGGYLYRGTAEPGYRLAGAQTPAGGQFEAALARLLEAGTEGASAGYSTPEGEGTVTLLGSVETGHGLSCRMFEDAAPGGRSTGIACRTGDGGWSVLAVPRTAGGGS